MHPHNHAIQCSSNPFFTILYVDCWLAEAVAMATRLVGLSQLSLIKSYNSTPEAMQAALEQVAAYVQPGCVIKQRKSEQAS